MRHVNQVLYVGVIISYDCDLNTAWFVEHWITNLSNVLGKFTE